MCAMGLSGCRENRQANVAEEQQQREFPMVTVPSLYVDPQMRAEYMAMHYWDLFDFRDTVNVGSAATVTEQALVNYIAIISYARYDVACKGIVHLIDLAESDSAAHAFFAVNLERYLYEADSPMHSDEFFMPALERLLASDMVDDTRKIRLKMMWNDLQKNRPGTPAAEIHYRTASGSRLTLSALRSEYILLVFHNLGCNACIALIDKIENSAAIKEKQRRNRLQILAIYPDKNLDEWEKHLHEIPSSWLSGFDYNTEIDRNETYVLRAIPSVYLLDKNKTVILRDAPLPAVEHYLSVNE
jgi:thiol-disulfide isomerase/thioredoxin